MEEVQEVFGEVIYSYSRKAAIEDGVLVDLSTLYPSDTRIYKYPVAVTSAVWGVIEKAGGETGAWVWDICYMSAKFPTRHIDETTRHFKVILGKRSRTLKAVCGPGDEGEPVITIMLPGED